jgi:riboflavin synthase alpha subunit
VSLTEQRKESEMQRRSENLWIMNTDEKNAIQNTLLHGGKVSIGGIQLTTTNYVFSEIQVDVWLFWFLSRG